MYNQSVLYWNLEGSPREIGSQLAALVGSDLEKLKLPIKLNSEDYEESVQCYKQYCPEILEELEGFAQALGTELSDLAYVHMTYLKPNCSGLFLAKNRLTDAKHRLIRNYEFGIKEEDFTVTRTKMKGKYAHLGGSIALFGRSEGINEKGLSVSMSSCGFPVSNLEGMRKPVIKGLQFWAVIRLLLENCKDVNEALEMVKTLPIAYNINLLICDVSGNACLVETLSGSVAVYELNRERESALFATNHVVLKDLVPLEPFAMNNSVGRLKLLESFSEKESIVSLEDIKDLFLKEYPNGLTVYDYNQYFGTIKTVVLTPDDLSYEICWLGQSENGWQKFFVNEVVASHSEIKTYEQKTMDENFYKVVGI